MPAAGGCHPVPVFTDGAGDGAQLSAGAPYQEAGLLLPAGPQGPGFLVFRNFDAIYSYNPAESYALAISHLTDRLAGHSPLRTPWPTDDPALTRAERRHLQQLLLVNGHVGDGSGASAASHRFSPNGRASTSKLP